ncbi:UNVERIFIED_ORG: putative MFS family arabinose efflux permease [Zoogloea ramigera]|uniref:MFS transporter n=1 Tax=Duganella zoogloeoides TaxID=75659 RepID=A0ABZ0XTR3_9BURK|nr:MFS transporter [Duganella zoogloeoides]WQH02621.1 MFS transporter [Duganella zoogloeoides]
MHSTQTIVPATTLTTPVLLLMAVATGLCAGSNYFNQPLLHSIAVALDVSDATAALTVTVSQLAYALGLLLFVPLGDMLERRSLASGLMLLAAAGLFISGYAGSFAMLVAGTVMTGLFSVAAQTLVPMAATLSEPQRSGRAVGLVMSGLLSGILLARSAAGLLSDLGGWHTVYRAAGCLMVLLALALWHALPASRNPVALRYGQVLRSLVALAAHHPRLRSRTLLGALTFASVSVLLSSTTLLLSGPGFALGDSQIGLVGLLGVAGAMMASVAGRLNDRGWGLATSAGCLLLLLVSWGALRLGLASLPWILLGTLLIDIALAGIHISNQGVIYQLDPGARSRINAVYMTGYFAGAATGSALGSLAWRLGGWNGVCVAGAVLALTSAAALRYDYELARKR